MDETRLKVMEAIARRRRVTALYNGTRMTLAPHQMFERHGALFISALNLDKAWRSDDERRLGHFKLDGLGAAQVEDEEFEPLPSFEAAAPFRLVKGFAVGRTIFHDVAQEWLGGCIGDLEAVERMATRFADLVTAWKTARARLEGAA